jgi:uncharacterized membrane protein
MPPPEAVQAYKQIDPAWPERLLAMAERAQAHDQEMERAQVDSVIQDRRAARIERRLGQVCAAAIALACIVATVVTALKGHDWVAGGLGTTTVVGLTTVFVTGRRARQAAPDQMSIPDQGH